MLTSFFVSHYHNRLNVISVASQTCASELWVCWNWSLKLESTSGYGLIDNILCTSVNFSIEKNQTSASTKSKYVFKRYILINFVTLAEIKASR